MQHMTLKVLIFSLCILSISCSEKEDNKLLGQIIGSVAGAYLGSKVGDGMVGNLTTVLGGTVGFLIGGKIVDILDSESFDSVHITSSKNIPFADLSDALANQAIVTVETSFN